jgi:hypothetical protein
MSTAYTLEDAQREYSLAMAGKTPLTLVCALYQGKPQWVPVSDPKCPCGAWDLDFDTWQVDIKGHALICPTCARGRTDLSPLSY